MSSPTSRPLGPDLKALAESFQNLRAQLGRDVRFYGHAAVLYDPSIPTSAFDDEGIPLDPLASGTAINEADVAIDDLTLVGSARCNVLFQPLAAMRRDQTQEQEIGMRSRLNKDLIMDISDAPRASGALYFMVGTLSRDADGNIVYDDETGADEFTPDDGELWRIVNAKNDGVGALQRYIVFGQGTL